MTIYILKPPEPALEPERIQVTRWRCPHCGRSRSSRSATVAHMARCWHNPGARSCKTCEFFEFDYDEPHVGYVGKGDVCGKNVELPVDVRGRTTLAVGCPQWKLAAEVSS